MYNLQIHEVVTLPASDIQRVIFRNQSYLENSGITISFGVNTSANNTAYNNDFKSRGCR